MLLHTVRYPKQADFIVDEKWAFELGGKNKTRRQIQEVPDSFRGLDDAAFPVSDGIPLWLFGFLY